MKILKKSDDLGTEPIVSLMFSLSIPSIIAMVINALYNVVDSIYIGRLSKEALSALSLAFPIQLILIAIGVGTGVGASSFISRQLGRGNKQTANNAAEHVIIITVFYGIFVALIGYFFSRNILAFFTSDPELIEMGTEYIRIIMLGSLAIFTPMVANNILRGEGNTFLPMIIMLTGSILNIILDPLFIFGIGFFPRWGIAGAAFATVLARIISGSISILILFSGKNEITLDLKNFHYDFSIVKAIYVVGLPAMFIQLLASIMIAGMNKILISYSATAVAAAGIFFRLQSFILMPVFGLNQSYMPILGYNYGYGNPERMKQTIKIGHLIAFCFTIIGFIGFQFFPAQLVRMFNNDPELIRVGTIALKRISLAFPLIGPNIVAATTFQALGKGLPSLILSFLRQIIILLPLMYILGRLSGLNHIWYAFPLSELVNAILAAIWLSLTLKKVFALMYSTGAEKNMQK